MKRYTQQEYLDLCIKKFQLSYRIKKINTLSWLFSLLIIIILYSSIYFLPREISNYLNFTVFWNFSLTELRKLVMSFGNIKMLGVILIIYWGFHIVFGIFIITFSINLSLKYWSLFQTFLGKRNRSCLAGVHVLIGQIRKFFKNPSAHNKRRIIKSIKSMNIYSNICPLPRKWYKNENYQWFSSKHLTPVHRNIIFTLSNFRSALKTDLNNSKPIIQYIYPLVQIEEFLLKVIDREDHKIKITDLNTGSEFMNLMRFAENSRPIIIDSLRGDKKKTSWFEKIITLLKTTFESQYVRLAILFSGIATAVMIIGVIIFKLDISTAFLTWFSVIFGSIIISFSVELIKQIGNSRKSQINPR